MVLLYAVAIASQAYGAYSSTGELRLTHACFAFYIAGDLIIAWRGRS